MRSSTSAPRHPVGAPAVAESSEPVAETRDVVLGQTALATTQLVAAVLARPGMQLEAEEGGGLGGQDDRLARMQPEPPAFDVTIRGAEVVWIVVPGTTADHAGRRDRSGSGRVDATCKRPEAKAERSLRHHEAQPSQRSPSHRPVHAPKKNAVRLRRVRFGLRPGSGVEPRS